MIDDPFDAVPQASNIESDEKADAPITQPQVRQQLCMVHEQQFAYHFQFHEYTILYHEIDTVASIDDDAVVLDRERNFSLDVSATSC